MTDFNDIKKYLVKIKGIVNNHSEAKLFNYGLYKRAQIDDLICCFLGTLPKVYKQKIELDITLEQENMRSIELYKELLKIIQKDFVMDKSLYLINIVEINKIINSLIPLLQRDLNIIEIQNKKD